VSVVLLAGATVVTMDAERRILEPGAVAFSPDTGARTHQQSRHLGVRPPALAIPHRPVSPLVLLLLGRQIDVYVAVDVPAESRGVFQHLVRHRLATLDGARY
jgi:hypothetical protein